jgi:predicted transcriptional regulator
LLHASLGETLHETAKALGLGEETVRSHFKKAQAKLGMRNRTPWQKQCATSWLSEMHCSFADAFSLRQCEKLGWM